MAPHYPQRTSDSMITAGDEDAYEELKKSLSEEDGLSPEDHQDLIEFLSRVKPTLSVGDTYLLIGSYDDLRRIRTVQNTINSKPSKLAVTFEDLIEIGDNVATKFRLLAELVDYIILVDGDFDDSNYAFEMGLLSNSMYADKVYLLSSNSSDEEVDSELVNQFQTLLEERNQVRRWDDEEDLIEEANELPGMEA